MFAVIDTETTWRDEVMSIGAALSDFESLKPIAMRYYILTPYKNHGGMYSGALYVRKPDFEGSRTAVISDLRAFLQSESVTDIFAYNALFDYRHLPELNDFAWYDIMRLAAYRQYNAKISSSDCYSTGRLKRGYGVENIYRMLSGRTDYRELHNALTDAADELEIMQMLAFPHENCQIARIAFCRAASHGTI
ncbi:MAG: hypothetical protein NC299_11255 [Lachnospiraceae bacterium]|nr:hypothetical protein [Ruminococcus sp.]MCM1275924.1 hypothetical protein [Lachnospiraceae bacterium]